MPLDDEIYESFTEMAEEGGSYLRLGTRPRVRCLVPDGIESDTRKERGSVRRTRRARVTVSAADIGKTEPLPGEKATLEHGDGSYQLKVSNDATAQITGSGALYEFELDNE